MKNKFYVRIAINEAASLCKNLMSILVYFVVFFMKVDMNAATNRPWWEFGLQGISFAACLRIYFIPVK